MKALKFQVTIGRDHRVVLDVPSDTPEGLVEVIVLVPETARPQAQSLEALLAEFQTRTGGRPTEELDEELAGERASWNA